jgi:hypothetical protein
VIEKAAAPPLPHEKKGDPIADPWLYRPVTIVLLSLFVLGPLALPLALRSPYLSPRGRRRMAAFVIVNFIIQMSLAALFARFVFLYFYGMGRQLSGVNP